MGASTYSRDDYDARVNTRALTGKATFVHDDDIKKGKVKAEVHKTLNPFKVDRESRDSKDHPVTVPIGVIMDTTGSMAEVPPILEKELSKLMGSFLDDKASGKKYLGDGYPAILIGAVDDYDAQRNYGGDGALQAGQFESGIEIDDNLENLWLTQNGGGTNSESYDLALYFFARHTVHDHFEKRGRKGYLFIIGDEQTYPVVSKEQVKKIIGDTIQGDIPIKDIVAEVQLRYHVFFIIPNMTSNYRRADLSQHWVKFLGQENVLRLEDPHKICEMIVSAVAICEEAVGVDDLATDLGVDGSFSKALIPLAKSAGGGVSRYSAEGLPASSTTGVTRL